MPPSVCCERALGARSSAREQIRQDVARNTELRDDFDIRKYLHPFSSRTCAGRQLKVDLHRFSNEVGSPRLTPDTRQNRWKETIPNRRGRATRFFPFLPFFFLFYRRMRGEKRTGCQI